jgi:hypothetical protein
MKITTILVICGYSWFSERRNIYTYGHNIYWTTAYDSSFSWKWAGFRLRMWYE